MGDSTAVDPKPTVGRVVHYVEMITGTRIHRPAIVLEVSDDNPDVVCLKVMTPGGDHVVSAAPCASPAEDKSGSWHWPERV
jgi:hypothetical protein